MTCPNQDPSAFLALCSILFRSKFPSESVGTYTVRDDVRVAAQRLLGVAVLGLIAGEVPDDQGLVTGTRQQHVGAIIASCKYKESIYRGYAFGSRGPYFSMEVARLVTQPFCLQEIHRQSNCTNAISFQSIFASLPLSRISIAIVGYSGHDRHCRR